MTWLPLGASALALVGLVSVAPSSWAVPPAGGDGVGRLAPETIRKVVRDSYGAFKDCYESLGQPLPSARVTLRFTIGTEGRVVEGSSESDVPPLGSCAERAMWQLVFPAPKGGVVTVVYPLMFEPG